MLSNKQMGMAHFKAAIVFAIITLIILCSCGNDSEKVDGEVKTGDKKLIARIINRDGTRQLDIVLLRVSKGVKFDSVKKEDVIVIDSIVGRPVIVKAVDSLGNIIKTKAGVDSLNPSPVYVPVHLDSVSFRVEGISVDTLLKKP